MTTGPTQAISIDAIEQQYPQCLRAMPVRIWAFKTLIPLGPVSLGVIITQLSR